MKKHVDYYDYCRQIRALKETKEINKSLKFLLLDFADRHGYDGMICPSNKTISEANCISENSIDGLLSRARKNKLLKTSPARKGKPRYITLLCPEDGKEIFLQIRKKDPDNFANMQKKSKRTYYIKDKEKIKETPLPLNHQINALRIALPRDIRYVKGITFVLKDGIDMMGYIDMQDLLFTMKSQSHTDFIGVLKERIKIAGYAH